MTLTKINPIEFIISLIFNNYLIENQQIENYIKLQIIIKKKKRKTNKQMIINEESQESCSLVRDNEKGHSQALSHSQSIQT